MQHTVQIIQDIIQKKPPRIVILSLVYVFIGVLIKWNIRADASTAVFVIGAVLGIYFLDAVEAFLRITPSPFTSILFAGAFLFVSIFIITSSNSAIASGLVLTTYATLIDRQAADIRLHRSLDAWYTVVAEPVSYRNQLLLFGVFCTVFVIESMMYFR